RAPGLGLDGMRRDGERSRALRVSARARQRGRAVQRRGGARLSMMVHSMASEQTDEQQLCGTSARRTLLVALTVLTTTCMAPRSPADPADDPRPPAASSDADELAAFARLYGYLRFF